jgi:aldose 1-epimerase
VKNKSINQHAEKIMHHHFAGSLAAVFLTALAGVFLLAGCATTPDLTIGSITSEPFGTTKDGEAVELYTLKVPSGMEVKIATYGGIITSIKVPDRHGKFGDVVLGFDNLPDYIAKSPFFGALVGRYGNRIAKGEFTLDGVKHQLAINNGVNSLHGGLKGFDKKVWHAAPRDTVLGPVLELTYLSKDGEEGYPGNLKVAATYSLTKDNTLRLTYTATTDKDTVVNLTQHSYFNLAGKGDVLNQVAYIPADSFTPVDKTLIPTGEIKSVAGTPFDFRQQMPIGRHINDHDEQIKFGNGYDHNFVINKPPGQLGLVGMVTDPSTGRVLEVYSTEPGVQFYTGNFLNGSITGKGGEVYNFRGAFCLEPQHFPNTPNQPEFPSAELKPGELYKNIIEYRFSVE